MQELYKKIANLKKDDYLVLSGSIPPSLPKDLYSRIASEYGKTANIIVDAEGDALLSTLPYNPFLIKPNHYELSTITNKNLESTAKIVDAAFRLQDLGARNIFVSLAEKGGIFVSESKDVYYSPAPCGRIVNSTGSGDSALAGFLSEYLISKNYKKAFTTGICAGSACAFSEHLATKEKIQELAERMVEN